MASNRCNSLPATDRALGSGMETESWAILGSAEPWQFKCAQYVKQVYLIESGHRIQCINAVLANPMCICTANPMCIYTLRFQPFAANLMQHFTIAANHAASSKLVVSVCAELYNVWLWGWFDVTQVAIFPGRCWGWQRPPSRQPISQITFGWTEVWFL